MPADRNRTVDVDVRVRSDTKDADKAAASLERIDRSAEGADQSLGRMSGTARRLNAEVGQATAKLKGISVALAEVNRESRKGLGALSVPVVPGRSGGGPGLLGLLSGGANSGRQAGQEFGKAFSSGLQGSLSTPALGPIMIASLVGAAVLAAPVVGGVLAGGISAALGTGGMAAGLLAAARDPRVKEAGKTFAESVTSEFTAAGGAFVQPAIGALKILESTVKGFDLAGTLEPLAESVPKISDAIAAFVVNIKPGLDSAFKRMEEFAATAGPGIAYLGKAFGQFLDDVTASPGALAGLETAFRITAFAVENFGRVIKLLADAYIVFLDVDRAVLHAAAQTAAALGDRALAVHLEGLANDVGAIADRARDAAKRWEELARKPDINKTATFTTITRSIDYSEHRAGERSPSGRAAGGPVLPGVPYRINEAGRETVTFPQAGTVHPASLTPVAAAPVTVRVVLDATGADEGLMRWLRKMIRIEAGGDVQNALGGWRGPA